MNTTQMYLVYEDAEGNEYEQSWTDLTSQGTLIDPETGEDLDMIGWRYGS